MKQIHNELRNFFDIRGLSQQDVADKMGTSKTYINALLNGKKRIGRTQALKMENLFGLSASWLLTGEGNVTVNDIPEEQNASSDIIPSEQSDNRSFQLMNSITKSLLDEIAAQRRVTEKAQIQLDRIITLLEKKI